MRKFVFISLVLFPLHLFSQQWESQWIKMGKDGTLEYIADADGDIIPDFSGVGFRKNREPFPQVATIINLKPSGKDDGFRIQQAIDSVAAMPLGKDGFRGAIQLEKGEYRIAKNIRIHTSGIILRGRGVETKLIAIGKGQRNLVSLSGQGSLQEIAGSRQPIINKRVSVGAKWIRVEDVTKLNVDDSIIVFRPATAAWIHDIQMDQIERRDSNTIQWKPEEYSLQFERVVTKIAGDSIQLDHPIVMAMEEKYGGGEIFRYTFPGRINNVAVEDILCVSEYAGDTDEDHGWSAVFVGRVENGWVKGVTAKHFGYSCVNLGYQSRNITVVNCAFLEAKSQITGGRRYSFNNDGQLNLVMNCYARGGRHDFVTGARVSGPNVFVDCKADSAFADIGPHHRWAVGTLYDNIVTDGEINVQDRGNWGTGHGWAGVTQVLWNCKVKRAALQQPPVSAKNYVVGLKGATYEGRLPGRPTALQEGQNQKGLQPVSLYRTQLKDAIKKEKNEK